MFRSHVLFLSILPLVLNILITPILIISIVSPVCFLKNPIYYIYTYGPVLWSIYHVLLAWLAFRFLKAEGQNISEAVGPLRDKFLRTVFLVISLLVLSVLLFQIIEPHVTDLIYGQGSWKQLLSEYKMVPLPLAIYSIAITSLTAGVCEEIVWRGYLQTRFETLLRGKVLAAILLQAALFGLWHSISVHTLFTAIFGFIYGSIYAKTRRLVPIMVSHWLGDIIGFSTMYFT